MSEYKYILNWPGRDWNGEIYRDGGDRYVQESSAYVLKADVERHGVVVSMVAWDGQGLPPVGTVCELRAEGGDWGVGTILYTAENVVVWRGEGQAEGMACCRYGHEVEVRPFRTPEQIAAKARKAAIEEMVYDGCGRSTAAFNLCAALYDAGYRKP